LLSFFYLLLGEFILGALCPLCTIVHITTTLLFYISFKSQKDIKSKPPIRIVFLSLFQWIVIAIVLHVAVLILFNYSSTKIQSPTPPKAAMDDFAKCLTEQKVEMYGSAGCSHCQRQKQMFGASFEFIVFHECASSDICATMKISGYPSWIKLLSDNTEEKRAVGVTSFADLSKLSGCKLEGVETTEIVKQE